MSVTTTGEQERYRICPGKGKTKAYQFALYAVPASFTVPASFVGTKLLQVVANPEATDESQAGGGFVADYTRPAGGHAGKVKG